MEPIRRLLCWSLTALALGLVAVAPAAAAPKGRVVVALGSDTSIMDPHMHTERMGIIINQHIFDTLLARDTRTWQPVPHLAESITSVSPTTWELKLRRGVRFHNGEPFTAESVKFSFDRVLNPDQKSPIRGNFTWIKAVDVVDDHTVRITTTKPYPLIHEILPSATSAWCRPGTSARRATPTSPGPGGHRPLPVRGVAEGGATHAGGQRAVLEGRAGHQDAGLPGRPGDGHGRRRRPGGGMLGEGRVYMFPHPWLAALPGLAIFATTASTSSATASGTCWTRTGCWRPPGSGTSRAAPPMPLRHLALKTRDLERTRRFHTDLLGLRMAFPHRGMLFLESPGGTDLLNFSAVARAFDPRAGGLDHFGLQVGRRRFAPPVRRLRRAGVKVVGRRGRWSVYVEDPNGYTVEVYAD